MNSRGVGTGPLAVASPCALGFAGAWLLAAPSTFGYADHLVARSDWASGAILLILSGVMLRPAWTLRAQWAGALVGAWLLFAPLAFWAPAAAYANGLFAGLVAVTFSMLLSRVPVERAQPGSEVPPGWSYNPSAARQRAPIIALAFLGFLLAQYMAAFQLGYHGAPWDPFFGDGTRRVLHSDVSKAFPVSDAGLGAFAYLVEALTGFAGGPKRWRTMPWMVLLFGVLVVPAGVISIILIILQPVAVGAWCTFCLFTALTTLLMISPAADEVVATLQYLGASRRAGRGFWRAFWLGGPPIGEDAASGGTGSDGDSGSWIATALGVNSFTPTLVASVLIGVWLMVSPAVLGMSGAVADNFHLTGPLAITFAVIALSDIGRTVRWVNVPIGAWLVVSPWVIEGGGAAMLWNATVAGILLVLLSIPRGKIRDRFAGFNKYIV